MVGASQKHSTRKTKTFWSLNWDWTPVRPIQCSLDVLQYKKYRTEYLDTECQSPDFHHLALTTCLPQVRQCIAKPHSIALSICALIPFSWTPTIIVRSCDLILILFLFNHIASLSRPRLFRISTTFDREFIGHHRVSSSPARQPIIVNSSSAQLASPSLPAQYCPIIARTHHRPDYSAHQTNKLYSVNIFFFSIIHPQFRHRFHY